MLHSETTFTQFSKFCPAQLYLVFLFISAPPPSPSPITGYGIFRATRLDSVGSTLAQNYKEAHHRAALRNTELYDTP